MLRLGKPTRRRRTLWAISMEEMRDDQICLEISRQDKQLLMLRSSPSYGGLQIMAVEADGQDGQFDHCFLAKLPTLQFAVTVCMSLLLHNAEMSPVCCVACCIDFRRVKKGLCFCIPCIGRSMHYLSHTHSCC